MNQCVPSWEVEEHPALPVITSAPHSNSNPLIPDVPTLNYEVAELTWKNGQLAMHGFGIPRLPCNKNMENISSSAAKCSWEKPLTGDTLESIVNQATKSAVDSGNKLVPWFDNRRRAPVVACTPMAVTAALTPCRNSRNNQDISSSVLESLPGIGTGLVGCSTRVGSCSVGPTLENGRMARLPDWSSRIEQSMSGSDTRGLESRQTTRDTCEKELGTAGFASTSLGSPGTTSSGKDCTKTVDDHDSACHSRNQGEGGEEEDKKKVTGKSLVSAKRGRCAAIHNQSERKRRDKINQRMKTLQKLVPNSSKTDKASMLDEVIDYLKQLQAQVQMINRMNMSSMMLPLALQQQLQMSMMAPMGMGMGVGMNMGMGLGVMDMNSIPRPNISGMPLPALHPNPFMPMPSWDIPPDRLAPSTSNPTPDPLSATFLACQSQPMTMDAYSRMASLYQQFLASSAPASKIKDGKSY